MANDQNRQGGDPIGLSGLGQYIGDIRKRPWAQQPGAGRNDLEVLGRVFESVNESYEALQDRYLLLKESNRQLAEEVAWLRDQCDDLSVQRVDFVRRNSGKLKPSQSRSNRDPRGRHS
jgi:hypothetical protein